MAVRLRLKRMGRTNRPSYRIVAADARTPRDGRIIENIGSYLPLQPNEDEQVNLDVERARHWVSVGAVATDTVASILKKHGIDARRK